MTTWTIATLERDLQPADMDGAVVVAHWRATDSETVGEGDDAVTYSASSYGTESLSLSDIGSNFIPFADLTNAITTGWVETAIGEEGVNNIKDGINVNIEEQINPTTETKTIT